MAALVELLGENVLGKEDKTVPVSSFTGEGKFVMLYFSAHWCPPCRGFTPKLVEFYKEFKETHSEGKNTEIVFVSSDKDEAQFKEYYDSMSWLALPFSDRDRKDALSKKFRVQGIPHMAVLNGDTGEMISEHGRENVGSDPKGAEFPWYPEPMSKILEGKLMCKNGELDPETAKEALSDKYIGLYFSAHWCPPCRGFTPQLVKTYNKLKEAGKDFEIVYVSWDNEVSEFEEYYEEMPWLALPHNDPRVHKLCNAVQVESIPTLVLLDNKGADCEIVNARARGPAAADPEGEKFPWLLPASECISPNCVSAVNDNPSVLYLTGGKEEEITKAKDLVGKIAVQYKADKKAKKVEKDMTFVYEAAESAPIVKSIRQFAKLPDRDPILMILDIMEGRKYVCEADDITEDTLSDMIESFKKDTLKWEKLGPE